MASIDSSVAPPLRDLRAPPHQGGMERFWYVGDHLLLLVWFVTIMGGVFTQQAAAPFLYLCLLYFLGRVVLNYRAVIDGVRARPAVIISAILPLLSVLWSVNPPISLRGGVQLVLCLLIAGYFAARFPIWKVLAVIWFACVAVLLINFPILLTATTSTVSGTFSHKNVMAFRAVLGVVFGLSGFLLWRAPRKWRWMKAVLFGSFLLCFFAVIRSGSATSLLISFMTIGVILGVWVVQRQSVNLRFLIISLGAFAVTLGAFGYVTFVKRDPVDLVLKSVGKERTLTGRTQIWEAGGRAIDKKPLLGWGFGGYWTSIEGERTRNWVRWPEGAGLYFHSTWMEYLVGFGFLGTALMAAVWLTMIFTSAKALFLSPDAVTGSYAALTVALVARSPVEVDLFNQFEPMTILAWIGMIALPRYVEEQRALKAQAAAASA